MTYREEILLILNEADPTKGLPLSDIVRNVYNMTSRDFFDTRELEDVRNDVVRTLRKESKSPSGIAKQAQKRGYYCLNENSQYVQQMRLQFGDFDGDLVN